MTIFIVLHGHRILHTTTGDSAGDQYVYTSPLCRALGKTDLVDTWPHHIDGVLPRHLLTKMESLIYKTDCDPHLQKCMPATNRFEL